MPGVVVVVVVVVAASEQLSSTNCKYDEQLERLVNE
jgi:hypothetical protein